LFTIVFIVYLVSEVPLILPPLIPDSLFTLQGYGFFQVKMGEL